MLSSLPSPPRAHLRLRSNFKTLTDDHIIDRGLDHDAYRTLDSLDRAFDVKAIFSHSQSGINGPEQLPSHALVALRHADEHSA